MNRDSRRMLCLGCSNTYGYDPHAPLSSRYPPEVRWTGRLQAAGWQVLNRGMNGSMVPAPGEARVFADLIGSLQPLDAVTLMFGTNDVLQGGSAQAVGERMAQFLRAIRESAAQAKLILIAPPPVTYGDWVQAESVIRASEALAACYRQIAEKEDVRFADAGQWGIPLAFDGVHFTPEGHAAFFTGLDQLLEKIME